MRRVNSYTGRPRKRGEKESLAEFCGFYADKFGGVFRLDGKPVRQFIMRGYWMFRVGKHNVSVHRFAWHCAVGPIPIGFVIDHIDRDRGNSWFYNLRCVTQSENLKNICPGTFKGQCKFALARLQEGWTPEKIIKEAYLLSVTYLVGDFKWKDENWLRQKGFIK